MNTSVDSAKETAHTNQPPYAGELVPGDAWRFLQRHPDATLVDVRTHPEWVFAGTADLSSLHKKPVLLSWRLYPDFEHNSHFISQLSGQCSKKESPLLFICKTGGRSFEAANAMAELGYEQCYNITFGMEGDASPMGQRGCVNGWKAEGLPWRQA